MVDTHNHNVQAAQKTIQTIRYNNSTSEALAYNKDGKYLTGKNNLIKTDAVLTYYGAPQIIRGQKYACYYIGNGKYIPLNSIGKIDGKNTFRLLNNSYIYNISGKKIGKLSYKYPVHFTNNLKKTNQDKKYFVIKSNRNSKGIISSTQKYYLPYKKIRNSYYYALGKGKYINVRNVATINGLQNCSNGEKVTVIATRNQKVPVYVENTTDDEKAGKWLPGTTKINGIVTNRVIVDGKTVNVQTGDMVVGQSIPNGTTITVNARTFGPQFRYQIKGTHLFIDSSDVKKTKTKVSNYLPYFVDLDNLTN
ncbi:surface layer protein [Lactobacillus kalixensis DSM 16043]|uniref:Surface layer protein n=1 Tax=Lactobacillus kalixensis DSM 16043 TaxID=1423763 RepID=A0A0R1UC05_9LACO|nr:surface layer protein [Lactobacillus kalixensis DSM 16043]